MSSALISNFKRFDPPRLRKGQLGLTKRRGKEGEEGGEDAELVINKTARHEKHSLDHHDQGERHGDEQDHEHDNTMWYDLFFDLTFVVIIASLAKMVEGLLGTTRPTEPGAYNNNTSTTYPLGMTIGQNGWVCYFLYTWLAYQMWTRETIVVSRIVGGDDIIGRVRGFAFLLFVCGYAASIPPGSGLHDGGIKTTITPNALRMFSGACLMPPVLMLRIMWHNKEYRRQAPGAILAIIQCFAFFSFSFLGETERLLGAMIYEFCNTSLFLIFSVRMRQHYNPHYMNERFGVLTLVILGETVAATVVASRETSMPHTMLLMAVVYSFWWIYFDKYHDLSVFEHSTRTIFVWLLHFVMWASNTAFAASAVVLIESEHHVHKTAIPMHVVRAAVLSFSGVVLAQNLIRLCCRWSKEALRAHFGYFLCKVFASLLYMLVPLLMTVFIEYWTCAGIFCLCFVVSIFRIVLDSALQPYRGAVEKEAACTEKVLSSRLPNLGAKKMTGERDKI